MTRPSLRPVALLWFAAVLFAGCSSTSSIGGSCSGNGDCASGLMCNSSLSGGYCTKLCTTVGSTSECGTGAVCDSLSGGGIGCEQMCSKQTDCRSGYECDGVSGSNAKACKVKAQADAAATGG